MRKLAAVEMMCSALTERDVELFNIGHKLQRKKEEIKQNKRARRGFYSLLAGNKGSFFGSIIKKGAKMITRFLVWVR